MTRATRYWLPRQQWLMLGLLALCARADAAELPGVLAWSDRVGMGLLASGVIEQVPAKVGQRIAKGELLLALDVRGPKAEVRSARAELTRANTLLEEAQREDDRAAELYDRTLLSDHERAQATIALREAQAVAQRARAHLTETQLALEHSRLQAPFDALVLSVRATPGQVVVSDLQSQVLVELAADKQMQMQVQTDLATAQQIERAAVLQVDVAGRQLPAQQVQIGFEPVGQGPSGAVYPVTVSFQRPDDLALRAGQRGRLVW